MRTSRLVKNDMYLQVWHLADQYRQWKSNNLTSIRLVKGKGHTSQRPKQPEPIPVSLTCYTPPGWGLRARFKLALLNWMPLDKYWIKLLVPRRVTPPPPSSMSLVPIYTPGWRETESSKVPCLSRQRDGRGLDPAPPDPEFEVLTVRPPMTPQTSISNDA